jgi:hypothetical protein
MGDDIMAEYGDIESKHKTKMGNHSSSSSDNKSGRDIFGSDGHFSFDFKDMDSIMKKKMKKSKKNKSGNSYRTGRHSRKNGIPDGLGDEEFKFQSYTNAPIQEEVNQIEPTTLGHDSWDHFNYRGADDEQVIHDPLWRGGGNKIPPHKSAREGYSKDSKYMGGRSRTGDNEFLDDEEHTPWEHGTRKHDRFRDRQEHYFVLQQTEENEVASTQEQSELQNLLEKAVKYLEAEIAAD